MMSCILVFYLLAFSTAGPAQNDAADPDALYAHYEYRHSAILRQLPGIRSLILHRPTPWSDPFALQRGESFLLAQMQFDSVGDLDAALRSEVRRQARADFHGFPPFSGEVTHEAMSGKVAF